MSPTNAIVPLSAESTKAKVKDVMFRIKSLSNKSIVELASSRTTSESLVITICSIGVQLNCDAAVLLFPAASVNVFAATSMVADPSAVGVNVGCILYWMLLQNHSRHHWTP